MRGEGPVAVPTGEIIHGRRITSEDGVSLLDIGYPPTIVDAVPEPNR